MLTFRIPIVTLLAIAVAAQLSAVLGQNNTRTSTSTSTSLVVTSSSAVAAANSARPSSAIPSPSSSATDSESEAGLAIVEELDIQTVPDAVSYAGSDTNEAAISGALEANTPDVVTLDSVPIVTNAVKDSEDVLVQLSATQIADIATIPIISTLDPVVAVITTPVPSRSAGPVAASGRLDPVVGGVEAKTTPPTTSILTSTAQGATLSSTTSTSRVGGVTGTSNTLATGTARSSAPTTATSTGGGGLLGSLAARASSAVAGGGTVASSDAVSLSFGNTKSQVVVVVLGSGVAWIFGLCI